MSDVIAPEIQLGGLAGVVALLDELADHESLEQRAAHGVRGNRAGIPNPQQPGGQTGIVEIKFGRLDQSFVEVLVLWRQTVNDVAGFQQPALQPSRRPSRRNPGVGAADQGTLVERGHRALRQRVQIHHHPLCFPQSLADPADDLRHPLPSAQ